MRSRTLTGIGDSTTKLGANAMTRMAIKLHWRMIIFATSVPTDKVSRKAFTITFLTKRLPWSMSTESTITDAPVDKRPTLLGTSQQTLSAPASTLNLLDKPVVQHRVWV